jgi:hypothetical protein
VDNNALTAMHHVTPFGKLDVEQPAWTFMRGGLFVDGNALISTHHVTPRGEIDVDDPAWTELHGNKS